MEVEFEDEPVLFVATPPESAAEWPIDVLGALGAESEGVEGVTVNRGTCNCSVVPCE